MPSIISATTTSGLTQSADNSGELQLATNNGTTAVTITTAQNVGIGTALPSAFDAKLAVFNGNIALSSTTNKVYLYYVSATNNAYLSTASDGSITFANGTSSPTERMRIDPSGNLLVGATATSSNAKFFVSASVADRFIRFNNSQPSAPFGIVVEYTAAAPNDTGKSFLFCADNSATRADIRSNGGLANYSANNVNLSDAREKTNVELAGSYIDKICAIPVKTFNYIDQNREEDDGLTLGVIAQDVQAVAPELVTESDWGTEDNPKMRLSIYQTDLQYALMKAIQEQQAIITDLKARIETLENK